MLAFSIDYYGIFFGATQSVELFCTYLIRIIGRVPAEMHVPDSFGVSVFFGSGAGAGSSTKAVV